MKIRIKGSAQRQLWTNEYLYYQATVEKNRAHFIKAWNYTRSRQTSIRVGIGIHLYGRARGSSKNFSGRNNKEGN